MKNILLVFLGIIIGSSLTFFTLKYIDSKKQESQKNNETINDILNEDYNKRQTCNADNAKTQFEDYYKFYINDNDFFVIPESVIIKDMGNCTFHAKFIRQSKEFKEIQHTNFIEISFIGNRINYKNLQ